MKTKRRQRSNRESGFSQVEALVASTVLMLTVSQSLSLFGSTLQATGKAQLRDGVNAAINADLEQVRHTVAAWSATSNSDGQLAYDPDPAICSQGELGSALLQANASNLPTNSVLSLSNAPARLKGIRITRTINTAAGNANLIQVSYATAAGSPVSISQSTTLVTPAQGWCS